MDYGQLFQSGRVAKDTDNLTVIMKLQNKRDSTPRIKEKYHLRPKLIPNAPLTVALALFGIVLVVGRGKEVGRDLRASVTFCTILSSGLGTEGIENVGRAFAEVETVGLGESTGVVVGEEGGGGGGAVGEGIFCLIAEI